MRSKMNSSRLTMVMAAAMGFLVLTAATPANALTESLAVKNVSVSGGIVQVTVKNVSLIPAASSVTVEAVVNGQSSFSVVPVVLLPGQSSVVSAAFTGAVSSVKSVGVGVVQCDMTDGDTPY
jgi:hypothetical protein